MSSGGEGEGEPGRLQALFTGNWEPAPTGIPSVLITRRPRPQSGRKQGGEEFCLTSPWGWRMTGGLCGKREPWAACEQGSSPLGPVLWKDLGRRRVLPCDPHDPSPQGIRRRTQPAAGTSGLEQARPARLQGAEMHTECHGGWRGRECLQRGPLGLCCVRAGWDRRD